MIRWLYEDAIFLDKNGRKKGALCLLLCLVDALAKQNRPLSEGNRFRYTTYLKDKLKSIGLDESYRIEEKNELIHISDIIYEYFRCNFVHEGDSRELDSYEIQIEYDQPKGFKLDGNILIDRRNERIIFKSDWLIKILLMTVQDEV
jgi:hypothetical protein